MAMINIHNCISVTASSQLLMFFVGFCHIYDRLLLYGSIEHEPSICIILYVYLDIFSPESEILDCYHMVCVRMFLSYTCGA